MKNRNNIIVIILIILIIGCTTGGVILLNKKENKEPNTPVEPTPAPQPKPKEPADIEVNLNNEFNLDMIKLVNSYERDNYLISTYSMEIALNMLKEGAAGETYNQINKVVPDRDITTFDVKNRISVANAIFVKNSEKKNISTNYIDKLKISYNADVVYDDFNTPDKINNWVNDKTYKMIPKILNDIPKDFVLGLANAVAIDVEWKYRFECNNTTGEDFTNKDSVKKVEMMHRTFDFGADYIKNDSEIGIVLPYNAYADPKGDDTAIQLEYIAIMPTEKDIRNYINDLTPAKLNSIINNTKSISDNQEVRLSLPRFEYDYNDESFADDLKTLGITDVFNKEKADLSKMKSATSEDQLYVSQAIHMTHISLNEKGTKAAAVTYFGVEKATAVFEEKENIEINFNKPFMYIIRDSKSKEMLFFGVVENPNEWKGSTCSNE